jgi:hypothetical protein
MGLGLCGILLCGCSRKVPSHLQPDSPDPQASAAALAITDLRSALAQLTRTDPLVRAPKLLEASVYDSVDQGPPLAAYVRRVRMLERGEGQVERELQQLEDEYSGTAVVALSRGYRLRIIENILATTPELDERIEVQIALLLTPLQGASTEETLPQPPLAWLQGDDALAERVRHVGDRWALAAWLESPDIPLAPVGEALDSPLYDGLVQTPVGALVAARAAGNTGDTQVGLEALKRATQLALVQAAADRDQEQAAWADLRRAEAKALGVEDPIRQLLQRASTDLTEVAGNNDAAGGALLALAALRWKDACGAPPCGGVDRVHWMHISGRWSDAIAPLAATWKVIALKESLDGMDVGHDTVLFPRATLALTDALLGSGAGPLDLSLLRRRRPEPQVWLELARATGSEGATDWSDARVAIGEHLRAQTHLALELSSDEEIRPLLERISTRAVP